MTYRDTKLYPTPENCQRDIDGETGAPIDRLGWWIEYLKTLLIKIPDDERARARIFFTSAGPEVWYPHLLSATEVLQETVIDQRAKLIEIRDRILADGHVSPDEQKWLAEALRNI